MKTKNRIISILLAVIMVLAIVPFSALTVFATEPEITEVSTFGELLNAVNSDKTYIKLTSVISSSFSVAKTVRARGIIVSTRIKQVTNAKNFLVFIFFLLFETLNRDARIL